VIASLIIAAAEVILFALGYKACRRDWFYVFGRKISAVVTEFERRSALRSTRSTIGGESHE